MADLNSKLLEAYAVLKKELPEDPAFEFSDDSRQWVERENYGKPDSANVAKVKVLYHEINLQGYCKSISKNKNIPTVKANANSVEATMLSNSKFFEINDAMAMVFETNSTTIQSGWWLDSGATVHVCKDKSMFKQFEDVVDSNVQKVLMANKAFAKVDGKGTVEIDFGSGKKITLFNVLYIPEIRKNLISIDLLCKMGLKVLFESDKVLLLNNDWSVVGNGHANDGMYQLSINNNITSNIASSAYIVESSFLWYNRFFFLRDGIVG